MRWWLCVFFLQSKFVLEGRPRLRLFGGGADLSLLMADAISCTKNLVFISPKFGVFADSAFACGRTAAIIIDQLSLVFAQRTV